MPRNPAGGGEFDHLLTGKIECDLSVLVNISSRDSMLHDKCGNFFGQSGCFGK